MNIELLLKESEKKLFSRAVVLTRNKEDAYDLLQITMEKIFKFQSSLDNDSRFLPWAYTIMRNSFYDNIKSKKNLPDHVPYEEYEDYDDPKATKLHSDEMSSMVDKKPSPEDSYVIKEKHDFTINLINQMKPMHRDMLNMFKDGYKYEEISNELNIKVGSVMSSLSRLREKISIEWELHINKGFKS